jgi:hypothetical protein
MKVTLQKPHTHAGIRYEAGATPDLPRDAIDWLRAHTDVLKTTNTPAKAVAPAPVDAPEARADSGD